MNIKILIFTLLLSLTLVGCEKAPTVTANIYAGTVVDVDLIPTSFNESIKSSIKTTKGVFLVRGMPSAMLGEEAHIEKYSNGLSYLCIQSWFNCRRISY